MQKLTLVVVAILVLTGSIWAQVAPPQASPPEQPGTQAQAQGQSQSWTGTLADANCKQRDAAAKCPVSGTTSAYGLVTSDGKFYKFDDAGNSTAGKEMQKAGSKSGDVTPNVTGALQGDTIKVQSIQIQ